MGSVNTNSISLAIAEESSIGVLTSPVVAEYLEPNEISDYGADITTVARNPISKDRQNRKGTISDVESTVDVEMDTTASHLLAVLPGVMFSQWYDQPHWLRTAVSAGSNGFTVTGGDSSNVHAGDLIYVRGFTNGANNGLFVVSSVSSGVITVAETTVEESGTTATSLYVVGHQFAAGDCAVDSGGNLTLTSGSFSSLGLQRGQGIYIGGLGSSSSFATAANSGLARVQKIEAKKLTLDKRQQAFATDAGTGKTIQIFYGWFMKNVPLDDAKFKEHYYQFEIAYPGLMSADATGYEYAIGNLMNTLELSLPLTDKSTMKVQTIGKDVEAITSSRKGWTFNTPLFNEAYNTTADFMRLRIQNVDETGLSTLFKEATLNVNNNASGERVLGKLGAEFMTYGNIDVSMEMTAVFTAPAVVAKIRNNCTVTMDFCICNNDAGFYFDIPSMTLGDGSRDYAVNEKVKINLSSNAFGDETLGYTLSETFFPYLPSDKAAVCS